MKTIIFYLLLITTVYCQNTYRSSDNNVWIEVPRINQGNSQLCAECTWIRVLENNGWKYNEAVNSQSELISQNLDQVEMYEYRQISYNNFHIKEVKNLSIENIAPCINRGIPIIWACRVPQGHLRLITGYNSAKNTILVSDTWNVPDHWMSVEQANQINMGYLRVLERN